MMKIVAASGYPLNSSSRVCEARLSNRDERPSPGSDPKTLGMWVSGWPIGGAPLEHEPSWFRRELDPDAALPGWGGHSRGRGGAMG